MYLDFFLSYQFHKMKQWCIIIMSAILTLYGSIIFNVGLKGIMIWHNMATHGTVISVNHDSSADGLCNVKFVFKDSHDRYLTGEETVICEHYKALMSTNIYYNHFAPEIKASTHSDNFLEFPIAVTMVLSGIASLSLGCIFSTIIE